MDDGVSATVHNIDFDIEGKASRVSGRLCILQGKVQKADKAARYEGVRHSGKMPGKCARKMIEYKR